MLVRLYPEKTYAEFGSVQFHLTWEEVKPSAKAKIGTDEDIDPDEDIAYRSRDFKTKDEAIKAGRELVDSYSTTYGQATVTKQVVGWFIEEERIAEWQDTDEVEQID